MLYPTFHVKRHYLQSYMTFSTEYLPRIRAEERRIQMRRVRELKHK